MNQLEKAGVILGIWVAASVAIGPLIARLLAKGSAPRRPGAQRLHDDGPPTSDEDGGAERA